MTDCTAQQTAQHVSTAFVRRHDTIRDHEGTRFHMVSDDTQGNILFRVSLIFRMSQCTYLIQKCFVGIYTEQGIYILYDHSQSLQAHTSINILLF